MEILTCDLIISPFSVAYTVEPDYFGYGDEQPPDKRITSIVETGGNEGLNILPLSELTYWLRWQQ